jgi:hypothetical protein
MLLLVNGVDKSLQLHLLKKNKFVYLNLPLLFHVPHATQLVPRGRNFVCVMLSAIHYFLMLSGQFTVFLF